VKAGGGVEQDTLPAVRTAGSSSVVIDSDLRVVVLSEVFSCTPSAHRQEGFDTDPLEIIVLVSGFAVGLI